MARELTMWRDGPLQPLDAEISTERLRELLTPDELLMRAAERGDVARVRELLEIADPTRVDPYGWTPLYASLAGGHVDAALALIPRSDVRISALARWSWRGQDPKGSLILRTPLMLAVDWRHLDLIEALVDRSDLEAVDERGSTAFHIAAQELYRPGIEALMFGSDLDMKPSSGGECFATAPLFYAGVYSDLGLTADDRSGLSLLMDIYDPNAKLYGMTPLMNALRYCSPNIAWVLLSRSDPMLVDDRGRTSLMHAVRTLDERILSVLIRKSDVDAQDHFGRTALMDAAGYGWVFAIEELLAVADARIVDHDGRSAADHGAHHRRAGRESGAAVALIQAASERQILERMLAVTPIAEGSAGGASRRL